MGFFVLPRNHNWTWRCFYCGIAVTLVSSTGSVARAMCVEIRVFWVCGYLFLSNFNLSPELAVPAELQVLPPGTNHSHSSTSAHFCCPLPGGENPLLVGLKSRGENCRQENIPGLSRAQSLGNSAWAQSKVQLRVKLFRQKYVSGHYLLLWMGFFPTCFGKVIKCLR